MAGAVWFGNSKQHFAFSAYDRLQGWNKLADKWAADRKEVDKAFTELKKEGAIISPVRCKWAPAQ